MRKALRAPPPPLMQSVPLALLAIQQMQMPKALLPPPPQLVPHPLTINRERMHRLPLQQQHTRVAVEPQQALGERMGSGHLCSMASGGWYTIAQWSPIDHGVQGFGGWGADRVGVAGLGMSWGWGGVGGGLVLLLKAMHGLQRIRARHKGFL
jgi:hypothetical protein